jgi:hypothetical protein
LRSINYTQYQQQDPLPILSTNLDITASNVQPSISSDEEDDEDLDNEDAEPDSGYKPYEDHFNNGIDELGALIE